MDKCKTPLRTAAFLPSDVIQHAIGAQLEGLMRGWEPYPPNAASPPSHRGDRHPRCHVPTYTPCESELRLRRAKHPQRRTISDKIIGKALLPRPALPSGNYPSPLFRYDASPPQLRVGQGGKISQAT